MHYIEPRDVTIRVTNFEMEGTLQGNLDSFIYESSNSHFQFWFPEGKIDSLQLDRKDLKKEQLEIVEACEAKIKEYF
ncbi:MAG TPA: hypothetical protein PKU77_00775 [Ferruginibacter sp.]|nr:hypothetical protein [Ferruginibacter sp.]